MSTILIAWLVAGLALLAYEVGRVHMWMRLSSIRSPMPWLFNLRMASWVIIWPAVVFAPVRMRESLFHGMKLTEDENGNENENERNNARNN